MNFDNWRTKRNTSLILGAAAAALVGAAYLAGFGGHTCTGLVKNVVEDDKGRDTLFGIRIIDVIDVQTVAQYPNRLDCKGLALFNSGEPTPIEYFAYQVQGEWHVVYELVTKPF
ncbi:hypothetical protein M2281_002806 [Mesorhizobium soli]|uniref:hypothetical protein n=1 Tax=Pseudaminobacter soli (ex Li et al. 2025) TaxID=1295366 RepID=UPI0024749223|nr:hypothetical protein [Mesorhizobium soli]MDH6232208.1 hypothetical protein [Mesorhizobium soli]